MNVIHVAGEVEGKLQRCSRCGEPLKDMREQKELRPSESRVATFGGGAPYVVGATIEKHDGSNGAGPWQTFFVGNPAKLAPYQRMCEPPAPGVRAPEPASPEPAPPQPKSADKR